VERRNDDRRHDVRLSENARNLNRRNVYRVLGSQHHEFPFWCRGALSPNARPRGALLDRALLLTIDDAGLDQFVSRIGNAAHELAVVAGRLAARGNVVRYRVAGGQDRIWHPRVAAINHDGRERGDADATDGAQSAHRQEFRTIPIELAKPRLLKESGPKPHRIFCRIDLERRGESYMLIERLFAKCRQLCQAAAEFIGYPYTPISGVYRNKVALDETRWVCSDELGAIGTDLYSFTMGSISNPRRCDAVRSVPRINIDIEWFIESARSQVVGSRWSTRVISVELLVSSKQNNHFIVESIGDPYLPRGPYGERQNAARKSRHRDTRLASIGIELDNGSLKTLSEDGGPYGAVVRVDLDPDRSE